MQADLTQEGLESHHMVRVRVLCASEGSNGPEAGTSREACWVSSQWCGHTCLVKRRASVSL